MSNLTIYCKDFEVTDAIQSYVEEKIYSLNKLFNEHELESITYNLRLGKTTGHHHNGKIFYAEISMHTPDKNYGCRVEEENTYVSIDLMKDELFNNITHHKSKVRTLYKKGAQKFKQELHEQD